METFCQVIGKERLDYELFLRKIKVSDNGRPKLLGRTMTVINRSIWYPWEVIRRSRRTVYSFVR